MKDSKYIVFKREEYELWLYRAEAKEHLDYHPISIDDAVVIRRQDVFAPPALDAYGNAILCVVEAIKEKDEDLAERLQDIADYFHGQANLAWQEKRKMPD